MVAASVRRVDHRDPPPQLRRPRVAARLLVHRVQPRLNLVNMVIYSPTVFSFLCGHLLLRLLQRLLVAVAARRHLDQAGEQQRVARHSLDRDLMTIFISIVTINRDLALSNRYIYLSLNNNTNTPIYF